MPEINHAFGQRRNARSECFGGNDCRFTAQNVVLLTGRMDAWSDNCLASRGTEFHDHLPRNRITMLGGLGIGSVIPPMRIGRAGPPGLGRRGWQVICRDGSGFNAVEIDVNEPT